MRDTKELKALYRGLRLYDELKSLENASLEWSPLYNVDDPQGLDEEQRREYWDARLKYERGVERLKNKVAKFIKDYGVSPIISFDTSYHEPSITLGFNGKCARGFKTLMLTDSRWLEEIRLTKPPRKLAEVFG